MKFGNSKIGNVVWWFGGLEVWWFGGLEVWWFGGLMVWWFGVWWFGKRNWFESLARSTPEGVGG